ncbi:MAG: right-handed parallel beta-helix repeat-containing protein, partial [Prevotellaceae bacterium]|nr:right-handed parallel beta-helix repeat-containing protein [Prevotellaceae bacterium]
MKTRNVLLFGLLLTGAITICLPPLSAKTWYVNSATTIWTGKPADDVKATIAEAITAAGDDDQVWVAGGVYDTLTAVITLKDKVSLYGGFAGTENAIEDRAKVAGGQPWEFQNPTVLISKAGVFIKPSTHTDATLTIIDGFTTEGYVNAAATSGGYAISYNATGAGGITVRNCIAQNTCQSYTGTADHGGIGVKGNTCVVEYCLIQNNKGKNGGGAYVEGGTIRNCVIKNNRTRLDGASSAGNASNAGNGGGVFILGTGKVYNCWIEGNTSSYGGGAFMGNNAGGLFYNNVVVNNTASKNGGAISFDERNGASVSCFPYNVTLANNTVTAAGGGGVYMGVTGNRLYNAILYNNKDANGAVKNIAIAADKTPVLKNNISEADLSTYGTGNVVATDSATLFGGKWLTAANSPGKDAGTVEDITLPATDITGDTRVVGAAIDIGPYEVQNKKVVLTFGAGVTVTAPGSVATSPDTSSVTFNGQYTVTFTLPGGYTPVVTVNGVAADPALSNGSYTVTVSNIATTATVAISAIEPVVVTVAADPGIVITYPSNETSFLSGKGDPFELRFTAEGYELTKVDVGG